MKYTPKNSILKFQQGGPMGPEAPMPEEEMPAEGAQEGAPGDNPLIALAEASMQALQAQDCQMAMLVCQGLVQIVQQMAGPQEQAPEGEPVFRKGGILLRRIKK